MRVRRLAPVLVGAAAAAAYRRTGISIIVLSGLYALALLLALRHPTTFLGQDLHAAIASAAFTELILSLVAAVAGRRDAGPVASALRRIDFASAPILAALAQAALVSLTYDRAGDAVVASSFAFATGSALIGVGMLIRLPGLAAAVRKTWWRIERMMRATRQMTPHDRAYLVGLRDFGGRQSQAPVVSSLPSPRWR